MSRPKTIYAHAYGVNVERQLEPLELEQFCFERHWKQGPGRFEHLKRLLALKRPDLEWNPWLERTLRVLCDDSLDSVIGNVRIKTISLSGCAAGGKTFAASLFGYEWWACAPERSILTLCTTTKDMLRRRVWSNIAWLHGSDEPGHLIDSRMRVLWEPEDDDEASFHGKHGIFGVSVRDGETTKAVQHLKGCHAARIMVVIDEAEATPEAIFETIPNMRKGAQEVVIVVIGNSVSRLDPHGQVCEPAKGWSSVSIDSESWPTKGIARWQIEPGTCLHFDGSKSPNVEAKETLYPYLYTWEDHCKAVSKPEYHNSMAYWSHDRGFWPPEGLSDRIFTEVMIEKYGGMDGVQFISRALPVAFLDPSLGGDECKLVFGRLGDDERGRMVLLIEEHITVPLVAVSKDEVDWQIASYVHAECVKRGVAPNCCGVDTVGLGRGAYAALVGLWSHAIQRVESIGAPTDDPASADEPRPAKELYDRRATEMWWRTRDALIAGQLRGLYREAIVQMCSRPYIMKGRKYSIETKDEFKLRLGRSPDDADCIVGICEIARRNGMRAITPIVKREEHEWRGLIDRAAALYAPVPADVEQEYEPAAFDSFPI